VTRLIVEADGGSRGNPGPAGYGAVVVDAASGEVLAEVAEAIGRATNNVAEYRGLVAGLRAAIALDPRCTVEVRMDSKLVVEQMSGRWKIKHADMRALADLARGVLPPDRVRYTWVPRAENGRADRLANEAMDAAAQGRPWRPDRAAEPRSPQPAHRDVVSEGKALQSDISGRGVGMASDSAGAVPDSARAPWGARGADLGEPTVLLLVRHGRTALTEERRMSGSGGLDPELSLAGRADAEGVAALLASLSGAAPAIVDVGPVSTVLCSPLVRTRQTAQAIADRLDVDVTVDDAWAEIGFGAWDGLTYGEIARRWPAELAAWQGSMTSAPPGGESLADHATRIRAARARVVAEHPGEVVVVVAHVTPIRCVVAEALDAGPAALWRTRIGPASVTAVRYWTDGGLEVLTVNRQPM